MLVVVEFVIGFIFLSTMTALIVAQFLAVGTEADERLEKMTRERQ